MVSYFPWAVTKAYCADSDGGSEIESLNMQSVLKAGTPDMYPNQELNQA